MSTLKVDTILKRTGTGTITVGQSGDTISIPSGATLNSAGTNTLTGVNNTPSFFAYSNADQAVSDNTTTKVACNTEIFDSGDYDASSNYRFTPTVAGKYYVYGQAFLQGSGFSTLRQATAQLYKNGNAVSTSQNNLNNNEAYQLTSTISTVMDMNGSSDYAELYAYFNTNNSSAGTIEGHSTLARTCFGAYRILGA